ncbi:DUF2851 family protein [Chitinophaga sp. Mgbs1]|uniref:DUF2851 family protein n=1 Tax=Chitinophaga solisilvae TaxID=1233460 RepID=A0A433W9R2_9BACT|nr:DUF2851 family protein [Chitinophaga solisilvae]
MHVNPQLSEELFQHIWKCRLFSQDNLKTTAGGRVQVLYPGMHNHHGGPDFTAARIKIDNTLWVGQVELHLRSSDWYRHGHQHNAQYSRIILHVVFTDDMPDRPPGQAPCLELQSSVSKVLLQRYALLRHAAGFVPCAFHARHVPQLTWLSWKERLLAERWERRMADMQAWLTCNHFNWEEVCYWALAQSYGMPVNAMPFLRLAQSLPFPLLQRYRHLPLHMEALLFGQAGMLEEHVTDVYALQLQEEYRFLRHKHQLTPMSAHHWNWLRMRPSAFPTLRIAVFAALLRQSTHLFSRILEAKDLAALEHLFFIQPSPYWKQHYRFGQPAATVRMPGKQAVQAVLINTVLPLIYLYGRQKNARYYQQLALHLLQQLPPEHNHITRQWAQIGITGDNALESQALLQLKQQYCDEKKCLQCAVGIGILGGK